MNPRPLVVSPQHQLLAGNWHAMLFFGQTGSLSRRGIW